MPNCKQCGKDFHACSSCDFFTNWEWHYCCYQYRDAKLEELIRQHAEEYHVSPNILRDFLDKLSKEGLYED